MWKFNKMQVVKILYSRLNEEITFLFIEIKLE